MKNSKSIFLLTIFALVMMNSLPGIARKQSSTQIKLKAELQQTVIPANTTQNAIIKISITAPELKDTGSSPKANVNLAIVLDKSGSMGTSKKIDNAKKAAIAALRMLNQNDIFSLIVYDTQAKTIVPAQKVVDKDAIESAINKITPNGSTALFSGVSLAANELRKHIKNGYINRIILLSDGLANVGPSSPRELGRMGTSLIKEGVSVSTIGVGNDYNEDLMTELAQNSDGNFYFVENSNDLPLIFSKELGSALKVAAKSLTIHIEFPKGVKPQGVLGHNYKIIDNKMDIYFNQVYGGHEKSLILQVEVPPEQANKKIDLASINMNYEDVSSGKEFKVAQAVSAQTSTDESIIVKSVNIDVTNEYNIINNAVQKQQAINEADKGNWQKAQVILTNAAKQLEKVAQKTGSEQLKKEAKQNLDDAKQLDHRELKNRKVIKGEIYQSINSQKYRQSRRLK